MAKKDTVVAKVIAINKLTQEQALAELKVLSKEVEFSQKFDKETPVRTLRKLVAEGRAALAEEVDGPGVAPAKVDETIEAADDLGGEESTDAEESDESDEDSEDEDDVAEEDEEEEDDTEVQESAPKGAGVHVFDKRGKHVRTYTKREHGKDYADLAQQFISKKGREGYTTKAVK